MCKVQYIDGELCTTGRPDQRGARLAGHITMSEASNLSAETGQDTLPANDALYVAMESYDWDNDADFQVSFDGNLDECRLTDYLSGGFGRHPWPELCS